MYHLEMAHLGMGLAGVRRDLTACHLTEFAQLRVMNFLCSENAWCCVGSLDEILRLLRMNHSEVIWSIINVAK